MSNNPTDPPVPLSNSQIQKILERNRKIWFSLTLSTFFIFAIFAFAVGFDSTGETNFLSSIPYLIFIPTLPIAFIVRSVIRERGRNEDKSVAPDAYTRSNRFLWSAFVCSALISTLFSFLLCPFYPTILPAIASFLILFFSYPKASPLKSQTLEDEPASKINV